MVVGGGPAGLSAATWAARYRRSVLVVDSGEYRNRWAAKSHGYLGSDPSDPMALLEQSRKDLASYSEVSFCAGRVAAARREADGRFVVTVDGEAYAGLRLILAMGVVDTFPEVDGFFDHYGTSVFHCATCDGYEAQGRSVVILGWGEQVVAFAVGLLDWADRLTVVTEGRPLEGDDRHRRLLARHDIGLWRTTSSRSPWAREPPPAWPRRSHCRGSAGHRRRRRRRRTPCRSWARFSAGGRRKPP